MRNEQGDALIDATMEAMMDKDRASGAANQAKGAIKDAAGKVAGDANLR